MRISLGETVVGKAIPIEASLSENLRSYKETPRARVGATDSCEPPRTNTIHQREMEREDHDKSCTFADLLALMNFLGLLFQQLIALLAQTQHRCTLDRHLHDRLENSVCDFRGILVFGENVGVVQRVIYGTAEPSASVCEPNRRRENPRGANVTYRLPG